VGDGKLIIIIIIIISITVSGINDQLAGCQMTKDIEDAERFLDSVRLEAAIGDLVSDPEQLALKLAEEEVRVHEP